VRCLIHQQFRHPGKSVARHGKAGFPIRSAHHRNSGGRRLCCRIVADPPFWNSHHWHCWLGRCWPVSGEISRFRRSLPGPGGVIRAPDYQVCQSIPLPGNSVVTQPALCFTLALLGQSLGISAAAGAFLIGTVIGDTDESRQITGIIEPIRDMFAALFFVSIGMLIDLSLFKDHILSAVIVSGVFIAGKIVANTAGTFVAGQGGRVSLQVGMGKPQIGEFSLAMMKIGAEHEAVRAFLYQVMVGVIAITSLVYP
jgi:hypothetical protein